MNKKTSTVLVALLLSYSCTSATHFTENYDTLLKKDTKYDGVDYQFCAEMEKDMENASLNHNAMGWLSTIGASSLTIVGTIVSTYDFKSEDNEARAQWLAPTLNLSGVLLGAAAVMFFFRSDNAADAASAAVIGFNKTTKDERIKECVELYASWQSSRKNSRSGLSDIIKKVETEIKSQRADKLDLEADKLKDRILERKIDLINSDESSKSKILEEIKEMEKRVDEIRATADEIRSKSENNDTEEE